MGLVRDVSAGVVLLWLSFAAAYLVFQRKKDDGKQEIHKVICAHKRVRKKQSIYLILLGFGIEDGDQEIAVGILVFVQNVCH